MKVILEIEDDKAEAMLVVLESISFVKIKQKNKVKKTRKKLRKVAEEINE